MPQLRYSDGLTKQQRYKLRHPDRDRQQHRNWELRNPEKHREIRRRNRRKWRAKKSECKSSNCTNLVSRDAKTGLCATCYLQSVRSDLPRFSRCKNGDCEQVVRASNKTGLCRDCFVKITPGNGSLPEFSLTVRDNGRPQMKVRGSWKSAAVALGEILDVPVDDRRLRYLSAPGTRSIKLSDFVHAPRMPHGRLRLTPFPDARGRIAAGMCCVMNCARPPVSYNLCVHHESKFFNLFSNRKKFSHRSYLAMEFDMATKKSWKVLLVECENLTKLTVETAWECAWRVTQVFGDPDFQADAMGKLSDMHERLDRIAGRFNCRFVDFQKMVNEFPKLEEWTKINNLSKIRVAAETASYSRLTARQRDAEDRNTPKADPLVDPRLARVEQKLEKIEEVRREEQVSWTSEKKQLLDRIAQLERENAQLKKALNSAKRDLESVLS